ncbi:MAG: hypothetical protein JW874_16610 [Spirochaetales bacterium]|nr:hypothetical protein [Spirochaetales bacterium]
MILKTSQSMFSLFVFMLVVLLAGCPTENGPDNTDNDTTPPDAPVVSGATPINTHYAEWTWNTPEDSVLFRCRLDSFTVWKETAATHYTSSYLFDGIHTLYVQAADAAGNWSESGSFEILVDSSVPDQPVVTGDGMTEDRTPTWSWAAVSGADLYRCQLNNVLGEWSETGNTFFTPSADLDFGLNVLYVQARNAAGTWSATGFCPIEICKPGIALSTFSEYMQVDFSDSADQWLYFDVSAGDLFRIYWNDSRYSGSGLTGRLDRFSVYHDNRQSVIYSSTFPEATAESAELVCFEDDERIYLLLEPEQTGSVAVQVDAVVLQYPLNTTAASNAGNIRISWDSYSSGDTDGDGLRDIDGYILYKSENGTDYWILDDTAYTDDHFDDGDYFFVTDYYYKVTSYVRDNEYGEHQSAFGTATSCNIPISEYKPPVPSASDDGTASVSITWNEIAGIDAYRVFRSETEDGTYLQLGTDLPPDSTGYEDTDTLTLETAYCYKLSVVKDSNESMQSEAADGYLRKYGPDIYENDDTGGHAEVIELSSTTPLAQIHTLDGYDFPLSGGDHFIVYNRTSANYRVRITFTGIDFNGNNSFHYYSDGSHIVTSDDTSFETTGTIAPDSFHDFNVSAPSDDCSLQYTITVELFED